MLMLILTLTLINTTTTTINNESVFEYLVGCLKKYFAGPLSFWCIWEGNGGGRQLQKCENYKLKKIIRMDKNGNLKFQ